MHGEHAQPPADPLADPTGSLPTAPAPPGATAAPTEAPAATEPVATEREAVEVALLDDRFGEKLIEVKAGTTLRFVNKGGHLHSVAAADGSFASDGLHAGDAYEVTLDTPGEYRIICKQHALRGMAAKVLVS
jgi:plastocyanin